MSDDYKLRSIASVLRNKHHGQALTAKQLSPYLGLSPITILRRARSGRIPSFRIGGAVRFDPGAISKWLLTTGMKSLSR
jgi:excisionase family DNA binding protein